MIELYVSQFPWWTELKPLRGTVKEDFMSNRV